MTFRIAPLLALALSLAAQGQEKEPALDLAPLSAQPAAKKKKAAKKKARKKARQPVVAAPIDLPPIPLELLAPKASPSAPAAASAAKPVQEPELALPPLLPPAPAAAPAIVKLTNAIGVLVVQDAVDAALAGRLTQGVRGVADAAPSTQSTISLTRPAGPCDDDACLARLGAAQKLDQVVFAGLAKGIVSVRIVDVAAKKRIGSAEAALRTPEETVAVAEALACKLLVPAGCTGELKVDAPAGVQLAVDGEPLRGRLPVGIHSLEARLGSKTTRRAVAVLREPQAAWVVDRELRILAPGERAAAPVAAVAMASSAPQRSPWVKRSGYIALGAGAVALAAGTAIGLKSRSDINAAESAFQSGGGAYQPSDLSTLRSGNSAARNANILFAASAVCLVTGALLTFAF